MKRLVSMPVATFHKLFQGYTPLHMISFTYARHLFEAKRMTKGEFTALQIGHAVSIDGHWQAVDKML